MEIGISPISGKRRSLPDVGGFLRQLGRGARAAITPKTGYEEWLNAPVQPRTPAEMGPKQDIYLQPGVGYFSRTTGDFLGGGSRRPAVAPTAAPGATTPIVTGLNRFGAVDRAQSDVYRQYAQTPAAQFERYFQTPEMTPYFGSAFQGKGAPTSAQAMLELASRAEAPTGSPLSSFYAAQSAAGRGSMDEIISAMGYKGTPMEQWAKANPMLAFREFNQKFPTGSPTQGPTPALPGPPMGETGTAGQRALEAAQYQLSDDMPASAGQRAANFLAGVGNPVTPTEALNQGAAVDANRGAEYLRAAQKMKTQGYQPFLPTAKAVY